MDDQKILDENSDSDSAPKHGSGDLVKEFRSIRAILQEVAGGQKRIADTLDRLCEIKAERLSLPDFLARPLTFILSIGAAFQEVSDRMANLEEAIHQDAVEVEGAEDTAPEPQAFHYKRPEPPREPLPKPKILLRKKDSKAQIGVWEKVFQAIRQDRQGQNMKGIMQKTGLSQKQISNALHKMLKDGKIQRIGWGVYTAVDH